MPDSHIVGPRIFARNLLANWGGLAAATVVGFLLTPFIVHHLGIAVYGTWSLINSLVGYLGLVDLGVRGSVGRYVNHYMARRDEQRVNEVIASSVIFLSAVSLVVCLLCLLIGGNFSAIFAKNSSELSKALLKQLPLIFPLAAVNLWFGFITSIYRNVLGALERFEINNAINMLVLLIRTAGVIFALQQGFGLLGLMWVTLFANLVGMLCFIGMSARLYLPLQLLPRNLSWERLGEMWKFGLASFITRTAGQLIYNSDQIVVMFFFGPTAVGVYSVATTLIQYGQQIIEQIGTSLFPSIMKAGSIKDLGGLRKLYVWNSRLAFYVGVLIYVGYMVFGGSFIALWMGNGFERAAIVLFILSAAEIVTFLGISGGSVLFSLDYIRFNLVSASVEAIGNIALSLFLVAILKMGPEGVALGTLLALVFVRGIAHPKYTTRRLQLEYASILKDPGLRGLALVLGSFVGFRLIAHATTSSNWVTFGTGAAVSGLLYLLAGMPIMFKMNDITMLASRFFKRKPVQLSVVSALEKK
jgi:O-antigen/teichoic acid export membrane protein